MSEAERKRELPGRDRWLLFALIVGPLSALWNQAVTYSLVPTACERGSKGMLHLVALVFFLLSLWGAAIGWRYRAPDTPESEEIHQRIRWMAISAIVLSLSCALIVVAMEIPNVILRSCD